MSKNLTQTLVHPLFQITLSFKSLVLNLHSQVRKNWLDLSAIAVLALAAALASFQGAQMINPVILDSQAFDVWFESDLPRIFNNMTDRVSNHYRVKVHPLFSLVAFPLTLLATKVLRVDPLLSVKLVISTIAALWISTLFVLLRLIGLRRLDAVLFSLLASISSASMFWFVVPETYSFGSLSIVLGLCFVVLAETRQFSSLWYAGMSALTLSMTTTNWMVGLLTTFVSFPKKKALQVTINAFFGVAELRYGD